MNLSALKKIKVPKKAGVYLFLDKNKVPIYIGKATILSERVKSYFVSNIAFSRSPMIARMVEEAKSLSFEETDSVLEALILESKLIKKYQAKYNIREKDNKSFNFVVVTKEDFPRILIVRERDLENKKDLDFKIQKSFGPFTQGSMLKEALKIIRKIFPFRDTCAVFDKTRPDRNKPCFNRQIELCPGVCSGEISKQEYKKIVKNIIMFFEGNKPKLIKELKKEMNILIKKMDFEKAGQVKNTIFSLNHIKDVSLIKRDINVGASERIEAYDVAHTSGKETVGVMTVVENGVPKKSEYRKFKIRNNKSSDDLASLKELLTRRFNHSEWPRPKVMVIDGGKTQRNIALSVLKELNLKIDVVNVVKNERHKPKEISGDREVIQRLKHEIILANSEAHRFAISYHRKLRGNLI